MMAKASEKFRKRVERNNKVASIIITIGGYGVVVSIILILLFLLVQSLPLSFSAKIKKMLSFNITRAVHPVVQSGVDQYLEVAYTLTNAGDLRFHNLQKKELLNAEKLELNPGEIILCAAQGVLGKDYFALGTNQGRIINASVKMEPVYEGDTRRVIGRLRYESDFSAEADSLKSVGHVEQLVFRENEDGLRAWVWINHYRDLKLKIFDPDEEIYFDYHLSDNFGDETPTVFTMDQAAEQLIVGSQSGELFWFDISDPENVYLKDNWRAVENPISAMAFLLGNNSLVIADAAGAVQVWFPTRNASNEFKFQFISAFDPHNSAVRFIAESSRNRTFITTDAEGISHINYATTGKTEVKFKAADSPLIAMRIAPKSNGIIVVDENNQLGLYKFDNKHPETSLNALYGKIWYEGYPQPEFVWQSTGGSDEFEPKFSLIPLIFGTLKGTLYAMIFSVPIALLAAIYVSQFSPRKVSNIIKPSVEIMAALPSVVIGFLAGLYFSPLFEKYLLSVFLLMLLTPVIYAIGVAAWQLIPEYKRMRMPKGWEILFAVPMLALAFALVYFISAPIESTLFADNFKHWLYEVMGINYDQRNSIVVGFALGFAVIPIIFTISEDALSNVPDSLTSASLALGASQWQTVRRVVLPAAAGGIFSAIMLGLGRAIGETMIVLMATGNTPILDISPFNGFRAMSACIAVEIPEAPVGGTLYRILFLTAFLLFIFTFFINSIAAIIGDRLRKKYARF